MILAEQLALVVLDPQSGRPLVPVHDGLRAALSGLLVGELVLDGVAALDGEGIHRTDAPAPSSPLLAEAAEIVAEEGPHLKLVLVPIARGVDRHRSLGAWSAVVDALVADGEVEAGAGVVRRHHDVDDLAGRQEVVDRLHRALTTDDPLDDRTALLVSVLGLARLVDVVVPDAGVRAAATARVDHALDGSPLAPLIAAARRDLRDLGVVP